MISAFNPSSIILAEANNEVDVFSSLDNITERGNHSYLDETYEFILSMNEEYYAANKAFYRSLLESGDNVTYIHESFGTFFDKIKAIIDKLLAFIKSIFERFVTALMSFIKSEKYLKKHKKDFDKFLPKNEFTFQGYDFTFDPSKPAISALAEFSDNFIFRINDNDTALMSVADVNATKAAVSALTKALESGTWYDNFRAKVIGSDRPIYKSDFADELFSCFRNGAMSKDDIKVDSSYINLCYSEFENHNKAISECKKTKERVNGEYNAIKKQLDSMSTVNYSNGVATATVVGPDGSTMPSTLSGDHLTQMDLYIKAKVGQVQEMSNIHSMAFAAKLDAYMDAFRQDKAILYKALSKIEGNLKEEY